MLPLSASAAQDRVSEFELKLMDISSENLGIPETEYAASVRMSSSEFQRICKDLSSIGDTVEMSVTKDGIKFSTSGDIGSASVICRQNNAADRVSLRVQPAEYDAGVAHSWRVVGGSVGRVWAWSSGVVVNAAPEPLVLRL